MSDVREAWSGCATAHLCGTETEWEHADCGRMTENSEPILYLHEPIGPDKRDYRNVGKPHRTYHELVGLGRGRVIKRGPSNRRLNSEPVH